MLQKRISASRCLSFEGVVAMILKGKKLQFISFIKRDGSGVVIVGDTITLNCPKLDNMSYLDEDNFKIMRLSISEKTFIACGFNSFIVKLRC